MLAPVAGAQDSQSQYAWKKQGNWLTSNYTPADVPPIDLSNSGRLEKLLRAGKLYLSLQDAIALALENNLQIEVSRYGPQIAEADLLRAQAGGLLRGVPQTVTAGEASVEQQVIGGATGGAGGSGITARGGARTTGATEAGGAIITTTGTALPNLDPQMFGRYSFNHRTNPLANTITTGGVTALTFDTHSWIYGLQKDWLTGTSAQFVWTNNFFEANNPSSTLNPSTESSWQLSFSQPLLRGFGRAVNNRNIRIASNNLRVSDLVFRQQAIETITSIVKLYWDLVAFAEDVRVKEQALALAEKLYQDNKKQVEIGTLAPIEITSAEAQVARRQQELLSSQTRLRQQETVIKNSLSRTGIASPSLADAEIVTTDRLRIDVEPLPAMPTLIETAMQNRPEIEQTQLNIENTRIGIAGSRSQLKPSLEASAFMNHNALIGQRNALAPDDPRFAPDPFFVGSYGGALEQLLRRNFPDYGLSVTLSIPLRNRSARADYIRDTLQLRQQQLGERRLLNDIRVEVLNAEIAVRQAKALYDAAVKERELQEETLQAEQKKYALGASTVFFVIQYQRDLAQAQSNEVAALASYRKARVDLDQAIGETLDTYHVDIAEARQGVVSRSPDVPAQDQQSQP